MILRNFLVDHCKLFCNLQLFYVHKCITRQIVQPQLNAFPVRGISDEPVVTLTPVQDVITSVRGRKVEMSMTVFAVTDSPVTCKWYKDGQEIHSDDPVFTLKK